jgi:hypothetical protein
VKIALKIEHIRKEVSKRAEKTLTFLKTLSNDNNERPFVIMVE